MKSFFKKDVTTWLRHNIRKSDYILELGKARPNIISSTFNLILAIGKGIC